MPRRGGGGVLPAPGMPAGGGGGPIDFTPGSGGACLLLASVMDSSASAEGAPPNGGFNTSDVRGTKGTEGGALGRGRPGGGAMPGGADGAGGGPPGAGGALGGAVMPAGVSEDGGGGGMPGGPSSSSSEVNGCVEARSEEARILAPRDVRDAGDSAALLPYEPNCFDSILSFFWSLSAAARRSASSASRSSSGNAASASSRAASASSFSRRMLSKKSLSFKPPAWHARAQGQRGCA